MTEDQSNKLSESVDCSEQKQVEEQSVTQGGWFPYPPSRPARLIPPIALAYIGDAVYEVAVRQYLLSKANMRPNHLHRSATGLVSAKAQSRILTGIEADLTDEERDIVRQGRNAKSGSIPKNADVLEYRHATALECLIGYLYSSGLHSRMIELIAKGIEHAEGEYGSNKPTK
ncbi:Mini-ribonuclease 3 [Paenibacillus pabuli]|uniref:Mini-ribonuclease 3 n=1 Tax=Paenibacillus pabuli TaxID=1472 RepID=UPI0009ECB101|nr:ribonuclease III domain-containing protein [Paenibacillus pabuli]MEC0126899.1 ribonuclease III domain-containing protein [Paenibacillus pabuli]